MKQIIDLETWDRKSNFAFFKEFLNPYLSITSEIECGAAKQRAKENNHSFFLYYLYAILKAANEVKELRYRLDSQERVVLYETVDVIAPIRVPETDRFFSVRIPWNADFKKFYDQAQAIISSIPADGDPYENETSGCDKEEFDVILVSALPDLHFTSINCTQKHKNGSDYPLLNAGKCIQKEGKWMMPIALAVHHGFIDGIHISCFYRLTEEYLNSLNLE